MIYQAVFLAVRGGRGKSLRSDVRDQMSEGRKGQKIRREEGEKVDGEGTEVGGQRSEVRRARDGGRRDRSQRSEVGKRQKSDV